MSQNKLKSQTTEIEELEVGSTSSIKQEKTPIKSPLAQLGKNQLVKPVKPSKTQ